MNTRERFTIIRGSADTKERTDNDDTEDHTAALALIAAVSRSPRFRQVDPHPHLSLVRRDDG